MKTLLLNKPVLVILILAGVILFVAVANYMVIRYNGQAVPRPEIPRGAENYGTGKPLTYAVLGDSTTVSQGGDYDRGYARSSARYIAAQGYAVTFQNFGVSGARARDVATAQAPEAAKAKPDIVLIAVGANDVTHLTSIKSVRESYTQTIETLRKGNAQVQIILTGSPDMGTVPRFPQPSRWIAGQRTKQINAMAALVVAEKNVLFAPIARETGPVFARHPELYAGDKFHPTTEGYDTWTPVITNSLDTALESLK